MTKPLHLLSIQEAGAGLRAGDISSVSLTEHFLDRIARYDSSLHSFILVTVDRALDDAHRADREFGRGIDRGPMHGIPYALKDVYDTAGIPTTCNSRLLVDHIPKQDSIVESKLKSAGGVLIGKLNTHEFALGGPSYDLPVPPARNPWNCEYFTGGSSSGSAVAVAAGLVRVALGTDTGGSIRSPASHCGVVGLKPTYGRVSRRGTFPLSYSLDHCGPLTWTVHDAALTMNVIAGYDPLDPGSANKPVPDFTSEIGKDIKGMKIGYARELFCTVKGVSSEVVTAMDAAAEQFATLGADVHEVSLPDFDVFKACGRIIMIAEAYAIHENDLKTRPLSYGRYSYQRIAAGAGLTAADLIQAFRLRRELAVFLNMQLLSKYDALITATVLTPASRFDEFPVDWPPPSLAVAVQTAPFNVTGNPTLSIPIGFSEAGLPLGMQVVGKPFDEQTLFRIAASFEAVARVNVKRPDLTAVTPV